MAGKKNGENSCRSIKNKKKKPEMGEKSAKSIKTKKKKATDDEKSAKVNRSKRAPKKTPKKSEEKTKTPESAPVTKPPPPVAPKPPPESEKVMKLELNAEGQKSAEVFLGHINELTGDKCNADLEQINAAPVGASTCDLASSADPNVPCFDQTRVKVENMPSDFYHCNKITLEKTDREWIIAQPPKGGNAEAFWRMVFHQQAPMVILLGANYEAGKALYEEFFPQKKDEYKYYGTMYVNNRKTETDKMLTVFTLEVLPEGCSNSLMMKLIWALAWEKADMNQGNTALAVVQHTMKKMQPGPIVSVSASGTGRSCVMASIGLISSRIFSATYTNVLSLVVSMREKRAQAVPDKQHYLFIYMAVALFMKLKVKKDKGKWDLAMNKLKELSAA